jgi:co-chaperonin GroES (HSP10)
MSFHLSKLNVDTTPADSPDPDLSGFHIKGSKLVLRPCHVEGVTKNGVILAGKTTHDIEYLMNVCKVLAVGPTAYTQEMFEKTGPWCKVGDFVLIPRLEGQKIKFKGTPLTIITCDRVIAVLDNPADVDPNFNIGV